MSKNIINKTVKHIYMFSLLFFLLLTKVACVAQSNNSIRKGVEEIVLKFPEMKTSNDYNLVKNTLESFKGVNVIYRCVSNQYIVLKVDKELQPDNMPMINLLREKRLQYTEIEGWDEQMAIYSCSDNKN